MILLNFYGKLRDIYYPKLPKTPHMDAQSISFFKDKLKLVDFFIEYGAGGSTLLAAMQNTPNIVSVESDKLWMKRVERELSKVSSKSCIKLIHADIGRVGPWGTPLGQIDGEKNYAILPWTTEIYGSSPLLVLIDGRFRITCFLTSLLWSPEGSHLLFDDYHDRDSYKVVENILKPCMRVGRSAVFIRPRKIDKKAIERLIRDSKHDSD